VAGRPLETPASSFDSTVTETIAPSEFIPSTFCADHQGQEEPEEGNEGASWTAFYIVIGCAALALLAVPAVAVLRLFRRREGERLLVADVGAIARVGERRRERLLVLPQRLPLNVWNPRGSPRGHSSDLPWAKLCTLFGARAAPPPRGR
jgi:hypothetical protein